MEIKGGVSYFLYSHNYQGKCKYTLYQNKEKTCRDIYLKGAFGVIVRDSMAPEILEKVDKSENGKLCDINFSQYVGPLHFFDNEDALGSNWSGYVLNADKLHNIKCYVNRQMDKRGYGWIKPSDVPRNSASIPLHKIYMPKAGGSGNDPIVIGTPFYGEPNSVCSFTYICIGYSPTEHNFTEQQCQNIIKYMKSCFFRYMVSIKKKTQNTSRDVFQFVPLQDFTDNSDIDWSQSVEDIDKQLYKKYNLSPDEIAFIESMIKPM